MREIPASSMLEKSVCITYIAPYTQGCGPCFVTRTAGSIESRAMHIALRDLPYNPAYNPCHMPFSYEVCSSTLCFYLSMCALRLILQEDSFPLAKFFHMLRRHDFRCIKCSIPNFHPIRNAIWGTAGRAASARTSHSSPQGSPSPIWVLPTFRLFR
jgi:hypothetical protein